MYTKAKLNRNILKAVSKNCSKTSSVRPKFRIYL